MRTSIKLLVLTLSLSSTYSFAADSSTHATSSAMKGVASPSVDNTDLTVREKNGDTLTPQSQSNSESDIKLLAAVRSAIVDDKNLSTAAHNVKIMAVKGAVTLRGSVNNKNEKARVEELTRKVSGVVSIDNQLDINTK
mgnify:CR=1 FL=1